MLKGKTIKYRRWHGTYLAAILSLLFLSPVPKSSEAVSAHKGSAIKGSETVWKGPTPTVWKFNDPSNLLRPSTGKGKLEFYDPKGTKWGPAKTAFGKASKFGLPRLTGVDARVMKFPAALPGEGFLLTHGAAPNGVFAENGIVSNYTLVMDLLWPKQSRGKYRALYQTDIENEDDAEMYIGDSAWGGIGISGSYSGRTKANRWHRIAITVQAASGPGGVGQMHKYIDGEFMGGHGTNSSGPISHRALHPAFLLFADNDGETAAGYVSSIYFIDRNLSMEEVAALGGPHAKGANVPGPAPKRKIKKLPRRIKIIAHRGDSCCAPENTLVAIRNAFDKGAAMIEVDVRWSGDGIPVLMHDERVERTTNGVGPVNEIPLKALKTFDAGSWFGPEFKGEKIPTLAEALKEAKGRGKLVLDVKSWKMGKGIKKALEEAGVGPDAIYVWKNKKGAALKDFRKFLPEVGILWGGAPKTLKKSAFDNLKAQGVVGFDLDAGVEKISTEFIKAAHKKGMFVSVYTILDPSEMRRFATLGVDAMETDFTHILKEMLP